MKELQLLLRKVKENKPNCYQEALEFYQLCLDEIEQGESEENEISLAIQSINELLKEE